MTKLLRRHAGFRRLWVGETTSRLGSSVTTVVMPLIAATTLGASAFTVSALAASAWMPWVLFGLGAGVFVDRHDRRRLMIAADVVAALLFLSVPIAWALGILATAQLLVVAFLAGCVSVVFTTAYSAFLLDLMEDPAERAAANGMLQGSASAVGIAGPGLGGALAQLLGAVTALVADCVSFVVSLVCLLRIREYGDHARGTSDGPLRRLVVDGAGFIWRDPLIRPLTLFGGVANFALVGYGSLLVVFLVRTVGVDAGQVGLLLALSSCGGVVGAFVGNPLAGRLGSGRALLLTKVCACPFALLIPLAEPGPRALLVSLGGFGVGLGIVAGNVISSSFWQQYVPADLFSRTNATTNVFNYGTIPLGALTAGALASALGVRAAIWIMAALLPASALILIASPFRRLRRLPAGPAPRPESAPSDPEPADPTPRRARAA